MEGIKIGNQLINIILYADEVILLANNTEELLKLCELSLNYGMDFEIRFNPNKTNIIEFFKAFIKLINNV